MEKDINNIMKDSYFNKLKNKVPKEDFERITTFARTGMVLQEIESLFDSLLYKEGLSKGRFLILIQLYKSNNTGLSVKELQSYHKVTPATLTGLIDTLEKDGLIDRVASTKDRRKVNIFLTEKGIKFMKKFLPVHLSNIKTITKDFPIEKGKQLLSLLIDMMTSFKNNIEFVKEVSKNEE